MRVATLNLFTAGADGAGRFAALAAGLPELELDVLLLQEAVVTPERDLTVDSLPAGMQLVQQRHRAQDGTGLAIATRLPVSQVQELIFERTTDVPTGALALRLDSSHGTVWVVNYLPAWRLDEEAQRETDAVSAARWIELLIDVGDHVIVGGDLDADPEASSVRFWTGRHALDGTSVAYRDCWESKGAGDGATFGTDNPYSLDWDWPFRRIDYLFVRCAAHGGPSLRIDACRGLFASPADAVSDHYGVVADLSDPPPTPF